MSTSTPRRLTPPTQSAGIFPRPSPRIPGPSTSQSPRLARRPNEPTIGLVVVGDFLPHRIPLERSAGPVGDVAQVAHVGGAAARFDMADRFPTLGETIRSGSARPDNVDVLARMCDRMTDAEIDVLIQSDNLIADAAGRLRTDSFRRRIHRLRDRIRTDHGQTAAEQAAKETMAAVWPAKHLCRQT